MTKENPGIHAKGAKESFAGHAGLLDVVDKLNANHKKLDALVDLIGAVNDAIDLASIRNGAWVMEDLLGEQRGLLERLSEIHDLGARVEFKIAEEPLR